MKLAVVFSAVEDFDRPDQDASGQIVAGNILDAIFFEHLKTLGLHDDGP
jgi:hypothetical protein